MIDHILTIDLTDTGWQSDWNGYEVGFPDVEAVGLYTQNREDGIYSFYIDISNNKLLDFWKDEDNEEDEDFAILA